MVFGSCGRTPFTLSRTSCAATSMSLSSRKVRITCETPSDEDERSSSMPLMVLTASSILSVTSVSICSGAAPGWTVVMRIVGRSILGYRSTPSFRNAKTPTTERDRMRTVAKTGRLTQSSASHCMEDSGRPEPALLDLDPVDELVDVLRRDALASLQASDDLDERIDLLSRGHHALFGAIAVDDEHATSAGNHTDGGGGHEH